MKNSIKDVQIRKASAEDIRIFYPAGSPRTSYAWIAFYKGIPACLAGLIVEKGGCIAFSEIKPGIDAPKMKVWRAARILMAHIESLGLPMFAACEPTDKSARRFVERLGFAYKKNYQGKELFIWQK
jgi:hypothetical protein